MKKLIALLTFLLSGWALAQPHFPVNDVRDHRADAYAFINATIHVDYKTVHEKAVLLIREGKVEQVGKGITPPDGYTVVDLKGKHIYPGLIDLYTNYGMPKPPKQERGGFFGRREQIEPATPGAYNANDAIKSQFNAAEVFEADEKTAKAMREAGFGAALTFRADGIARGSSALVTLGEDSENTLILSPRAASHYSLRKGTSQQSYPSSPMGAIALLRQTWMDAQWYESQKVKPFTDQTLDAWLELNGLPRIFEADNWKTLLRADKIGDEFGAQFIIKSGGDDYQRLAEVKKTGASLIVPVDFPEPHDVQDPWESQNVSLSDMMHWEHAPANPATLSKEGVNFAITAQGIKSSKLKKTFWKNLRKAIAHGLSEQEALKALTYTPAKLAQIDARLGSLESGKIANFIISNGNLFHKDTEINENWIQGKRFRFNDPEAPAREGLYTLKVGDASYNLKVSGEPGDYSLKIEPEKGRKIKVKSEIGGGVINLSFNPSKDEGLMRLSGWMGDTHWSGNGESPDGKSVAWTADYQGPAKSKGKEDDDDEDDEEEAPGELGPVIYPFTAYGNQQLPTQETLLITGATVWTNEDQGILEDTDVLLKDGKIAKIGKGLKAKGARVIDGKGKHLTAGVIDEHSHIALDGTNDVAVNSGMVRMKDMVDSEDINIYRQLSGGVVASQLLHGSANPVGGQSAMVKLRWGATPENMLVEDADGFIKFALGENVKRSRSNNSIRYPQTRMGVEQVYVDAFTAAREYEKEWKAYNALSSADKAKTSAPRKDILHDTMLEILNGERFITCHSYVQSEINMLMKVAEQFGFRVNTFTHILEGYKVADIMAEHGVGGSTFADWWNYKWEVRYAIPYGPSLMTQAGVVVAVNSDDAEMGRRLNQEAAKSVKYGGMSEEDALKMVTLNPAKLLHLDDRMGSIKEGKDADVVLWSDHPLSIYAKSEKTIVDGIVYFDRDKDAEMRNWVEKERHRLIQKMAKAKKGSSSKDWKKSSGTKPEMHCDTILEHMEGAHETH